MAKTENKIVLEFQIIEDCPNVPQMLSNIHRAISGLEDKINLIERIIYTPEIAAQIGFRGSPTLLINGEDLENLPSPKQASISCRYYPNGIPSAKQIREKIEEKINEFKINHSFTDN
ncbi:MAG: DUF2703 domain-containing protein [Candidatus Kapabacteria bacterium]|nr:DUF2703 domain-containing protein [Candidatus Kapabacteria bacterium]